MTRKKYKPKQENILATCKDALLHLESISGDLIPIIRASIDSVYARKMTDEFRLLFCRICNQLMNSLDYMATSIQSVCPKKSKAKAYFLFGDPSADKDGVIRQMGSIFPGLDVAHPVLYDFMLESQPAVNKEESVLQELRRINRRMKHHKLLPAGPISPLKGIVICNFSAQPDRPPMWVWTKRIQMSSDSKFIGGPGSLIAATDGISCEDDSEIFGVRGADIASGAGNMTVKVLNCVPLWYVQGFSKPILQFIGEALNEVAKLVRTFVTINGHWESLWPQQRIVHFGQIYAGGGMTLNPGIVEAAWKEDARSPTVSLSGGCRGKSSV